MNKKPTTAGIVIVVAGAVVFLASFFAFYTFKAQTVHLGNSTFGGTANYTAWNKIALFPVSIIPAWIAIVMGAQVALTTWADVRLPDRILGMTWKQIHLVLGVQAALLMLAFLVRDNSVLNFGIGFWLMLFGSLALAVGAVMLGREPASASGPASAF
jgi:hypothetical protein